MHTEHLTYTLRVNTADGWKDMLTLTREQAVQAAIFLVEHPEVRNAYVVTDGAEYRDAGPLQARIFDC